MIELRGVSKYYKDVKAVDGLSFTADRGDIFGIIGPNGAGKSTTIRMILDIIRPDEGEVVLEGDRAILDRVGYLPEERGLYKKETVQNMLLYLGRLKGASYEQMIPSLDRWLERFGLEECKHKKVDALSKGMSQKIQFIGAMLHDPDIIILDEPFSGMDPLAVEVMKEVILEEAAKGKTVLFSTHVMEQAEKLCQKILLLNKGKALAYGPLGEIKGKYGSGQVQVEFDGDGSFLERLDYVRGVTSYPRYVEISLAEGEGPDRLFSEIAGKLRVKRFEVMEPSLHSIFLDLCGGAGEGDHE